MITAEQRAHFETFGFLLLRKQFSPVEMDAISREFESIMLEDRQGRPYSGERQRLEPFIERHEALTRLIEDDRIYTAVEALLGPGFVWDGSDGNHYVGDTQWHPDKGGDAVKLGYGQIKVIFYLDKVTRESGCLRVIPGSHKAPLHNQLEPLVVRNGDSAMAALGVTGADIPCHAIESEPGDVVFFHQSLYHASFGGWSGRRMFTMVFGADPVSDEEVAYMGGFKFAYRPTKMFLKSGSPKIRGIASRLADLGFEPRDP